MSAKSVSKSVKETPEHSHQTIDQRISEKRDKLYEIHAAMSIHFQKELTREQRAEASILQDRLEFRTKAYEEQLLDEKIDIFTKVLAVIRK